MNPEELYIARDLNGALYLYIGKPVKSSVTNEWEAYSGNVIGRLREELTGITEDIKWEDSWPKKVKIINYTTLYDKQKKAEEYEKSISDPNCPFYTPEDIIKAFLKGIEYVDSKR